MGAFLDLFRPRHYRPRRAASRNSGAPPPWRPDSLPANSEPTRSEDLLISLTLSYDVAQRNQDHIKAMGFTEQLLDTHRGDTLTINYAFFCRYFGDVEGKLRAVEALLYDGVPVAADIRCVNKARSVIVDTLARLTRIQDFLESK